MERKRILIADDEEGIRESLNLILSEEHDVTVVKEGAAALAKLANEPFDLALLDIKMPKMDGLEVIRQLKSRGIQTRLLMLTAYQSVEFAKEAVKLGAIDYLTKPFERDAVVKAVQDILSPTSTKVRNNSMLK